MEVYYIGMDVHSGNTSFCFGTDVGKVRSTGKVETSLGGMRKMIKRIGKKIPEGEKFKLVAGMESGNSSFRLAKILEQLKVEVHVIHAKEVRDKTQDKKKKTDKRDAHEIYEGMWRHYYRKEVYIPTNKELKIRWFLAKRQSGVKVSTIQILGAKDTLRRWGLASLSGRKLNTEGSWKNLIKELQEMEESQWLQMVGWEMEVSRSEERRVGKECRSRWSPYR